MEHGAGSHTAEVPASGTALLMGATLCDGKIRPCTALSVPSDCLLDLPVHPITFLLLSLVHLLTTSHEFNELLSRSLLSVFCGTLKNQMTAL